MQLAGEIIFPFPWQPYCKRHLSELQLEITEADASTEINPRNRIRPFRELRSKRKSTTRRGELILMHVISFYLHCLSPIIVQRWKKYHENRVIFKHSTHFHQWMTYLPLCFSPTLAFPEVIVNTPQWKSSLRYRSIFKRAVTPHLYEGWPPSICPGWLLCIHNSCGSAAIWEHAWSFLPVFTAGSKRINDSFSFPSARLNYIVFGLETDVRLWRICIIFVVWGNVIHVHLWQDHELRHQTL